LRQIPAAILTAFAMACSTAEDQSAAPAKAAQAQPATATTETDLPAGWKARVDGTAAQGSVARAKLEKDSLTVSSGPAAIYYKPDMKAEKDYTVSAAFSQLKPTTEPQPYGLFIAGADLEKDTGRYTAFLVRGDGRYQIAQWTGGVPKVIVDWTVAPQMREPKGVKTSNSLTVRALQGAVHFLIGEKEVHQMPRSNAGPDGVAGIRVGRGLNLQVDNLSVKKFP
jgi:hypothetical protein